MKLMLYFLIKKHFHKINKSYLLLTILICLSGIADVFAKSTLNPQQIEIKVSLKLTKVSITKGLSLLEEKADCVINYNSAIFKTDHLISIEVKDTPVSTVLKKMLEGTGVTYKIADPKTILLYKLPNAIKPGRITGKITDEKGEVLPGAGIRIIELNRSVSSSVDGNFSISVEPGNYTVEVSYVSYQTKRITGITVKSEQNVPLNISLSPATATLNAVVVTADYKKASAEGLLIRQKNASEISNGISSEQMGRTPDKNIGESLKRISGISTIDNKFVIVRGIGERYNAAVLDGTPLPSTEAQERNFSFDLIPSSLVDNVVVSKTITPDMNTSFGGGLIQINTKDIPAENFLTFAIGTSYNDQSTGKPFYSRKHGKYDYLGFDDGRRSAPKNLVNTNPSVNQEIPKEQQQQIVDAQSRRFTNDNFTLYKNIAQPGQNYQFTLGRLISIDTAKGYKLGFTTALSYRNTQSNNAYGDFYRGNWSTNYNNSGNTYGFNTTWGGILNAGVEFGNHRLSLRNTYTRTYNNELVRTFGFYDSASEEELKTTPPWIQDNDDPTFTGLLQNKIAGQHQLGKVKLEWDAARTAVNRDEKDLTTTLQVPSLVDNKYIYTYVTGRYSEPKEAPMSRQYYHNNESHYTWNLSGSYAFTIGNLRNNIKIGYYGNRKDGGFDWKIVSLTSGNLDPALKYLSVSDMQKPENMRVDGYSYQIWYQDKYAGKSRNEAGYFMLDNRLAEKLRLVWGVRADYYKYTEISNPANGSQPTVFTAQSEPAWRWLPSANLTYNLTSDINLRTSWSQTVVRPELMDNSQFYRFKPSLNGMVTNIGLVSTKITSYDFRSEWFPSLGETISIGGFYKYFDKPVELNQIASANVYYSLSNSDWAKVYGLEFEFRKKMNFIDEKEWLNNLTLFGNVTLQKSRVQGRTKLTDPKGVVTYEIQNLKRPMYGQSPYLVNAGLQYQAQRLGFNLSYNKSGRKTYIVSSEAGLIDYEMPRSQTDFQLSYKWLANKLQVKLNAGNIFNRASAFYKNRPDPLEKVKPGYVEGKSDNYEPGEMRTYTIRFGRTYSIQLNYNF